VGSIPGREVTFKMSSDGPAVNVGLKNRMNEIS